MLVEVPNAKTKQQKIYIYMNKNKANEHITIEKEKKKEKLSMHLLCNINYLFLFSNFTRLFILHGISKLFEKFWFCKEMSSKISLDSWKIYKVVQIIAHFVLGVQFHTVFSRKKVKKIKINI